MAMVICPVSVGEFGRRVKRLVDLEVEALEAASDVTISVSESADATITLGYPELRRSEQLDFPERTVSASDEAIRDQIRKFLMATLPAPRRAYCCAHSPRCAVHQPLSPLAYADCTCGEPSGRMTHLWQPPDLRFVEAKNAD
jgi:hypothetical protein